MLILNVIDNGLVGDCVICGVLIMKYNLFCKDFIPEKWVVLLRELYLVYGIY